ncbi:MAG: hypothetical protein QOG48_2181 [Verrucomicrobiota bacterium]|jgi:hypothetical protein
MLRWIVAVAVTSFAALTANAQTIWQGHARDAQHTAMSAVRSQPLSTIVWQTPVDLQPQYDGNDLFIHYGTPLVTAANTIIVPVKTGANNGFELKARRGRDGALLWKQTSDYTLPLHGWTASYGPTLTPQGRLYWPGAGGTLLVRDNVDAPVTAVAGEVNFYVTAKRKFNRNVKISTPLTSDASGNIYFGYEVDGPGPKALKHTGIARVDTRGRGTFVPLEMSGGPILRVTLNCAPALSNDGRTLYVSAHGTAMIRNGTAGFLFALDSRTLHVQNAVPLLDPQSGEPAEISDDGTASPTVGPDGRVFYGVLDNPPTTSRGWLLQFSADLSQSPGVPGAFGWDDTASIVPASLVASYHGSSAYLLMTKYNNYAAGGGDGKNRLAILDPNDCQMDARTGMMVMREVLTILGQTPDPQYESDFPGAVREWCINTAVVDLATNSVLANSEDGKLYRWDLTSNSFSEIITLTAGIGEAYTPTIIGADGKVYAINNATLFAIGAGR